MVVVIYIVLLNKYQWYNGSGGESHTLVWCVYNENFDGDSNESHTLMMIIGTPMNIGKKQRISIMNCSKEKSICMETETIKK